MTTLARFGYLHLLIASASQHRGILSSTVFIAVADGADEGDSDDDDDDGDHADDDHSINDDDE